MAAALGFPVGNPLCDWCYATEPESMMQHPRRRHRRPAVRRCRGDLANGGDNIGVYVPVFATTDTGGLFTYLLVFLALVAVCCAVGYYFARRPAIARAMAREGVTPFA